MLTYSLKRHFLICVLLLAFTIGASAQFNSGSTGADGALDLATMNCPPFDVCEIQLPESGVLNYTTVDIPAGKLLRFRINSRNTPATVLAQGPVNIQGGISVSSGVNIITSCFNVGPPIIGPGGFRSSQNGRGFGPGGGTPESPDGKWVGPLSLVPIVGGSGPYAHTGAGGGALTLASSSTIVHSGSIWADGSYCGSQIARGSGGAIRLVANSITATGNFSACGGTIETCGVVRLEATSINFTGSSSPAAVLATINPVIIPEAVPRLTIATVGGYSVPSYSGSRTDTVDLLLPNQFSDPIPVGITASNIPTGTQVNVGFASGSLSATSSPCNLAGSFASSSCTATISNLNRTAVTYLLATAAFDPPAALAVHNPKGPDQVAKVRLEAVLGATPKYMFLNGQGKLIDNSKISKTFLAHFGIY